MLHDLKDTGYVVDRIPQSPRALLDILDCGGHNLPAEDYRTHFAHLPAEAREAVLDAWGEPAEPRFTLRAATFGNVTVALAPDRGRSEDRRADYHDPTLPPRHELVAFGLWMQKGLDAHAIVHVGAHGTLEWLPGKTVALSATCFPEIVTGPLPVVYPFIVSNPGEAAQAKRRISAVTLGHLPPPLASA
jgi:cobaltochelatase CobN